jgi:hypothetical protein
MNHEKLSYNISNYGCIGLVPQNNSLNIGFKSHSKLTNLSLLDSQINTPNTPDSKIAILRRANTKLRVLSNTTVFCSSRGLLSDRNNQRQ